MNALVKTAIISANVHTQWNEGRERANNEAREKTGRRLVMPVLLSSHRYHVEIFKNPMPGGLPTVHNVYVRQFHDFDGRTRPQEFPINTAYRNAALAAAGPSIIRHFSA